MFNISQLVEVRLRNQEDFLKVKETLSRIGLASKKDNTSTSHAIYCTSRVDTI